MPLGKYYCDYCDKEFQDTSYARKRHLQGVQHQRSKSLWYHSLRTTSGDSSFAPTLGLCNRFLTSGSCPYGDSCKYLDPKQNPHSTNTSGTTVTNYTDNTRSLDLMEHQQAGGASLQSSILRDGLGISLGNLPPSLKPPPEGGYPSVPFVDWG
ncbi:zinc finger CCCH domain-containing protein 3 isoform X1 [Apium graveolens]|uniref:zinc finger CCCH domain-containing protein 3 isoform X1 n=1 Tax=Apium graveolens TaxID=4045 RepID=UPI003D7A48E9